MYKNLINQTNGADFSSRMALKNVSPVMANGRSERKREADIKTLAFWKSDTY
jgi:hypothetical protein